LRGGRRPAGSHPNYRWSVRLSDLITVPDSTLFEIANAHTTVNNPGAVGVDGDVPSTEALWDSLLRAARSCSPSVMTRHNLPQDADDYELTRPGRSWIMVRADTLTARRF
jgi:hypothetical protein